MSRRQIDPLRPLTAEERHWLTRISRSHSEPAAHVARAKALLAVAAGQPYTAAAHAAGRRSGDAVAHLVGRFNREGLAALEPRHAGGPAPVYTLPERARILAEARRTTDWGRDGTATWSLTTLQRALRRAPDGLPQVSTFTIRRVLHDAGLSWQRDRSWCATGQVLRKRKAGTVVVSDPDAAPKKKLIEAAYTQGERLGLAVWGEDEAGPFQTLPYPGQQWDPAGRPARYPHEPVRNGTAKLLTLFHPASGTVRVKGVTSSRNAVLHGWMEAELSAILTTLPVPPEPVSAAANRACWARWQEGLAQPVTLSAALPPLRMLLVLDTLTGHKTPSFVCWLFAHGIIPLTPRWAAPG